MKRILVLGCIVMGVAGCNTTKEQQVEQLNQQVVVIAKTEEVTVYKVYDSTPGGAAWIYFTSKGVIR